MTRLMINRAIAMDNPKILLNTKKFKNPQLAHAQILNRLANIVYADNVQTGESLQNALSTVSVTDQQDIAMVNVGLQNAIQEGERRAGASSPAATDPRLPQGMTAGAFLRQDEKSGGRIELIIRNLGEISIRAISKRHHMLLKQHPYIAQSLSYEREQPADVSKWSNFSNVKVSVGIGRQSSNQASQIYFSLLSVFTQMLMPLGLVDKSGVHRMVSNLIEALDVGDRGEYLIDLKSTEFMQNEAQEQQQRQAQSQTAQAQAQEAQAKAQAEQQKGQLELQKGQAELQGMQDDQAKTRVEVEQMVRDVVGSKLDNILKQIEIIKNSREEGVNPNTLDRRNGSTPAPQGPPIPGQLPEGVGV